MPTMARHAKSRALSRFLMPVTVVLAVGLAALLIAVWQPAGTEHPGPPAVQEQPTQAPPTQTATPPPPPPPDAVFTIMTGGDVLPHATVIRTALEDGTDGAYDFVPMLAATQEWTSGADLAICNMEVPLAPPGTSPSGYPVFGAPDELAHNLRELGWDGCSTATNHTLDRGMAGASHTLDVFDEVGLGHAGSARDAEEAETAQWYELEREGQRIRVANIAATYGTNGIPLPEPWVVELIDAERLIDQATRAREAGADLVVASIHCCSEYRGQPDPEQVDLAQQLADSGVIDLYVGHHAHVPQPIEKLSGGPDDEGMWVIYGLGNFISNQDENCCVPQTATGLLATATVVKPHDEPARVREVEWTAVTVDRLGRQRLHVLAELAASDRPDGLTLSDERIASRYEGVREVVGSQATERTEPPTPTGEPAVVLDRQ